MIDKLIDPTIKYIKDKSKISLNKQQTINLINKTIQQLNFANKTQLNKDEQKLVLSTCLSIVENENSLEYILENLENERNQPVIDILEDDFNINENQIDRNDLKINFQEKQPVTLNIPNKKFKTLLIQTTTTNFNYQFPQNTKIIPHKIITKSNSNIITLTLNNNYICHFYKNDDLYHTIDDIDFFVNNTNKTNIKLSNLNNTQFYKINELYKFDDNHYKIILDNPNNKKSDIKIYNNFNNLFYNFYYITDDLYITENDIDLKIDLNKFKAIFSTELIYIICKYQLL